METALTVLLWGLGILAAVYSVVLLISAVSALFIGRRVMRDFEKWDRRDGL